MSRFICLRLPKSCCCYIRVNSTCQQGDTNREDFIMGRIETISFGVALAVLSSPAFAGDVVPVGAPAPIAGVGVGAVVLIGLGYRALKRRFRD
jgi:hypothetical protein